MFPLPFGFLSPISIDPDAQAFFDATGITDTTQKNAVNQLVIDLKNENLWTQFDVIYPFVGGTADSHKYNLKDPRNADDAFRINYFGSWTHTAKGMRITAMGGANRAETLYSPFDNLSATSNSQVVYYTELVSPLTSGTIGCYDQDISPTPYFYNGAAGGASRDEEVTGLGTFENGALIITTRDTDSNLKYKAAWDDNPFQDVNTNTGTGGVLPDMDYFLGATLVRIGGVFSAVFSDGGTYGFVALGNGLGTSASNAMATIVKDYQTALGRAYVESDIDPDAQEFLTAAAITDPTETTAINNLVNGLKSNNLWDKMKAIYPMVGGTATTCKWNLKDPRDLDAAFRITFSGGWTFSSTGAQPNGTNSSGNTYYNPFVQNTAASSSLSYYSRTGGAYAGAEMGANSNDGLRWLLLLKYPTGGGNGVFQSQYNNVGTGNATVELGATTALGLFTGSRRTTTAHKGFRNATQIVSNTQTMTDANPNANVTIGAFPTLPSNRECAWAHIGSGLTDSDVTNLNTVVQAFNTTLSRNV